MSDDDDDATAARNLRELGKQLPFDKPDADRREAVRSSLLVAAMQGSAAVTATRRRWLLVGGGFAAGALAAAALAIVVISPGSEVVREAHARIEAPATATLEHTVTATASGTDEVIRVRAGTVKVAVQAARRGDRVRMQTADAEVEATGAYEVVVVDDRLERVTVTVGTAQVTTRVGGKQQQVFLAAGQTWRPRSVTAAIETDDLELPPALPSVPGGAGDQVAAAGATNDAPSASTKAATTEPASTEPASTKPAVVRTTVNANTSKVDTTNAATSNAATSNAATSNAASNAATSTTVTSDTAIPNARSNTTTSNAATSNAATSNAATSNAATSSARSKTTTSNAATSNAATSNAATSNAATSSARSKTTTSNAATSNAATSSARSKTTTSNAVTSNAATSNAATNAATSTTVTSDMATSNARSNTTTSNAATSNTAISNARSNTPTSAATSNAATSNAATSNAATSNAATSNAAKSSAPASAAPAASAPRSNVDAPKSHTTTANAKSPTEQHFQAGWKLLRDGKPRDAAIELAAAADADASGRDPLAADARYFQAVALVRAGQTAAAERVLVVFIDRAGPRALRRGRAVVLLGKLLRDRGDHKSARAWFESALADADPAIVAAARAHLDSLR